MFCQSALETYMINPEKINLKLKIVLLALGQSPVSKNRHHPEEHCTDAEALFVTVVCFGSVWHSSALVHALFNAKTIMSLYILQSLFDISAIAPFTDCETGFSRHIQPAVAACKTHQFLKQKAITRHVARMTFAMHQFSQNGYLLNQTIGIYYAKSRPIWRKNYFHFPA